MAVKTRRIFAKTPPYLAGVTAIPNEPEHMDGNRIVSGFINNIRWELLPPEVQRKARLCLLDALGATISGAMTKISKITASYAAQAWRGDEATIVLHGKSATAAGAAFANGCAANGFDSDDGAIYTRGHPGAQLFPTTLAISEKLHMSGKEMLTAVVVGYEVAIRTARCWHNHHEIYQACGSWGSVANAAATAHLMRLNGEQIENALGIAEYHAPNLPMMRDVDHPSHVKHGIGWGAMTGITAAELASIGFIGIPSILGFEKYYDWVADIGKNYLITDGVTFKEFASCGWSHTPIVATRQLLKDHNIPVSEIDHIRIDGFHETIRLGSRSPKTTEAAQFDTAWPLAAYLLEGEVGPPQMCDERLEDEKIIAMVKKIELIESETFTEWAHLKYIGDPNGKYACQVEISLKNGVSYKSPVVSTSHDYGRYWDEERLGHKFRWLVQDVISKKQADQLAQLVWEFDQIQDVHELTALLQ